MAENTLYAMQEARSFFELLKDDTGYILDMEEAEAHAMNFIYGHIDLGKLGSAYGYTPSEALRFQIEEYARTMFGWSDPREGVPELQ